MASLCLCSQFLGKQLIATPWWSLDACWVSLGFLLLFPGSKYLPPFPPNSSPFTCYFLDRISFGVYSTVYTYVYRVGKKSLKHSWLSNFERAATIEVWLPGLFGLRLALFPQIVYIVAHFHPIGTILQSFSGWLTLFQRKMMNIASKVYPGCVPSPAFRFIIRQVLREKGLRWRKKTRPRWWANNHLLLLMGRK